MADLAEEHLAQALASRGGLGLTSLIATGLKRADDAAAAAKTGAGQPGASGVRSR
jgi:Rod binding domain-containing protein